jgi:acyl-CoA reductase-like NAD-dependent aldehyde dehydrogenase
MLHIPLLRWGRPYKSLSVAVINDHRNGKPLAEVSQANSGLLVHDMNVAEARRNPLADLRFAELVQICKRAGQSLLNDVLPVGDEKHSFDEFLRHLSLTTGQAMALARRSVERVAWVLGNVEEVLAGLSRGLDMSVLDGGVTRQNGRTVSYFPEAKFLGAILPSNSPGVHQLWAPAIAMKMPLLLKAGREEPWTPYRVIQAFIKAGAPPEAFGFYPTDHAGSGEILRKAGRSLLFGDGATTRPYLNNPAVEIHGPGYSKVIFGPDCAESWNDFIDVTVESIFSNGGRSCINCSAVWTPAHHEEIADALARKLAGVQARSYDDPEASIAAFNNPKMAEMMDRQIEIALATPGAEDVTARYRKGPRLVKHDGCTFLLPTIIRVDDHEHPLLNKEYLFPFASVVKAPVDETIHKIGPTLTVTLLTRDERVIADYMGCRHINGLKVGPIPTSRIFWDQPFEGNMFEHLYTQRNFVQSPEYANVRQSASPV